MQVFLNLILNAEQAMREVRDRGTLRIRLEKSAGSVSATFQDDGPGIPPDILPNIFDPFYTTKRPGRGTGLGLSICKAILREHGGNVEAASGPGGGAVFTVTSAYGEYPIKSTDIITTPVPQWELSKDKLRWSLAARAALAGAIVLSLAEAGAEILLHYNRNEAAAQAVARELPRPPQLLKADLQSPDAIETMFTALAGLRLDILVNNAGIWGQTPLGGDFTRRFASDAGCERWIHIPGDASGPAFAARRSSNRQLVFGCSKSWDRFGEEFVRRHQGGGGFIH